MPGASTTHRPTPGKSILVICCGEACLDDVLKRILAKPWPAPVTVEGRYWLSCQNDTFKLMLARHIEVQARAEKFDGIYTCGHVYLQERYMHMLQARLLDFSAWLGYFPKFP